MSQCSKISNQTNVIFVPILLPIEIPTSNGVSIVSACIASLTKEWVQQCIQQQLQQALQQQMAPVSSIHDGSLASVVSPQQSGCIIADNVVSSKYCFEPTAQVQS